MENNLDNFNNLEMSIKKTSVIQERVNLVSSHMYKQYLDYNHAMINTKETFIKMSELVEEIVGYLKQSFTSRGVPTENIYFETDETNSVLIINILWKSISIVNKHNNKPQALQRTISQPPLFAGRIIAIQGNYNKLFEEPKEDELSILIDKEVASLYIPPEKNQEAIAKIRHLGNKEFLLSQIDAPREFLLKVIETICGGGILHEENKLL